MAHITLQADGAKAERNGIRVITAMNRKGGCGKSTMIRGLASAASDRGEYVTIFDTDGSKGLLKWSERSRAAGNWNENVSVISTLDPRKIEKTLDEIYEQPDQEHLVLIDTFGGGANPEAQDTVADMSHLIIAPMMLAEEDYAETIETAKWYARLKTRAADSSQIAPFFVLPNRVPNRPSADDRAIMDQLTRTLPVVGNFISSRNAYQRMGNGLLREVSEKILNPTMASYVVDALNEMDDILKILDGLIRESQDDSSLEKA